MIMIFLSASKCNTGDKFSNKGIIKNDVFKAEIVKEGYIDCFPNKSLVVSCEEISGIYEINCEASAIEFINQELYIASDKRLPDYAKSKSPIFKISFPIPENPNVVPVDSEVILGAEKFEDLSSTVDGEYLFAITAFDRQRVTLVIDEHNRKPHQREHSKEKLSHLPKYQLCKSYGSTFGWGTCQSV